MKSQADTARVFPSIQYRCVWMQAGVLSYQLCDRNYECEECPLDAAMRKQFPSEGKSNDVPSGTGRTADCLYCRNHCWIKAAGHDAVCIGIEPGLAGLLTSIKEIVLPQDGQTLVRGRTCLWIVLDGGTFPVSAPYDGIVQSVNPLVIERPHECHLHPLTEGWLYKIKLPSAERIAEAAMEYGEAVKLYDDDLETFKRQLTAESISVNPAVGSTLQDGGHAVRDLSSLVGQNRYVQILREAFSE